MSTSWFFWVVPGLMLGLLTCWINDPVFQGLPEWNQEVGKSSQVTIVWAWPRLVFVPYSQRDRQLNGPRWLKPITSETLGQAHECTCTHMHTCAHARTRRRTGGWPQAAQLQSSSTFLTSPVTPSHLWPTFPRTGFSQRFFLAYKPFLHPRCPRSRSCLEEGEQALGINQCS